MNQVIFENYENFINENKGELNSARDIVKLMNDEGMFREYADALCEGLSADVKPTVMGVLNREREMLLSEAANVSASSFAQGWTVMSFPILVDIYSEPIIAELANVYNTDKPILSIPRVRIKSTTKSYDGNTETSTYIPTSRQLVRAGQVEINASSGSSTNVFTTAGVSSDSLKMNRRYTLMTKLVVTEEGTTDAPHEHEVSVNFRPDNRNQISRVVEFSDSTGETVEAQVNGHVDYEKGTITYNVIYDGGHDDAEFSTDHAVFKLRFVPYATMNGRTKVTIETEQNDVTIDPNEDFLIDVSEEEVQDFSSIFKIDLLRTLSEAIKRQILLNKDYDLAYFLEAAESDIDDHGAKMTLDLDKYTYGGGDNDYMPGTVKEVIEAVVPRISTLMSIVRQNYHMYPTYMVTGLKTASLLRSLQDFMVNMPGVRGQSGFNGSTSQFLQLKILESSAIADNKMYLSTKAPNNALEKSSIIDLIYQPLYIVREITDGQTRHYVRSRTMVEIARTDGLAALEVENIDKYVG
ncbi:MAG: hypothetical protein ACOC22_02010 [bacterium]